MSDSIRSGFAQEQQASELQKLNAILEALRKSPLAAPLGIEEERDFAHQSIADVFEQITTFEKAFSRTCQRISWNGLRKLD